MAIKENYYITHPQQIALQNDLAMKAKLDPEAFGQLFELLQGSIFGFILNRTGNVQDAQDLTSKTFLNAFVNIEKLEVKDGIPVASWFFTIARNQTRNFYRDQKRHNIHSLEARSQELRDNNPKNDPVQVSEKNEGLAAAIPALNNLRSDDQKKVIFLKCETNMTFGEIGQKLGKKSGGAAKQLWVRGITRLRKTAKEV
ncbi:RNA polymerase sigma factor [Candidatus Microgenomates bacterium]|nr:MAG: RNA polymerase sigma factor [Candidatus Microgenomates bacterium]